MDAALYLTVAVVTAVAFGLVFWAMLKVVEKTDEVVTIALNQAADARRAVIENTEFVADLLDGERAAHIKALDSQRHQAVELVAMVLHGQADPPDDTPLEQPGVEPPDAVIVDSELEDPSDAWLSDDMLSKLTPPLPVHEVDPATIRRSGQTGVIGE